MFVLYHLLAQVHSLYNNIDLKETKKTFSSFKVAFCQQANGEFLNLIPIFLVLIMKLTQFTLSKMLL